MKNKELLKDIANGLSIESLNVYVIYHLYSYWSRLYMQSSDNKRREAMAEDRKGKW